MTSHPSPNLPTNPLCLAPSPPALVTIPASQPASLADGRTGRWADSRRITKYLG
ncbi:hypothetical protein BS50DRAFT_220854 [Corynespora cassiicola Philippines]|uniref:Uncharacterized protein n=1 Tax=Corynespora cassiicola Philippines TaxID=1448308 RepID=A0A2T2N374_CORCC|nr:hypothetical protein BS50DRAFT_220854 [Corynespora cassiicola Philippines]